ncbi:MAG: hypothetical protein HYU66_05640 [Armatimonadetes bacterium]|nr:hypothetical protein [Armatimonadota bacterium]
MALIADLLAARASAADDLTSTIGEIAYKAATRSAGGGGDAGPDREIDYCASSYSLDLGGEHYHNRWFHAPNGPAQWEDQIYFEYQNAVHREDLLLMLGPGWRELRPQITDRTPSENVRDQLCWLGLGETNGQTLLTRLQGNLRVIAGRALRGHPCDVVVADNGELWMAADLDGAPVRIVQRVADAKGPIVYVQDWLQYATGGALALPHLSISRTLKSDGAAWRCANLTVSKVDAAAAGPDAVTGLKPALWHVPLLAGSTVVTQDRPPNQWPPVIGFFPHDLVHVAEADCRPWGLSAKALWDDLDLKLPTLDAAEPMPVASHAP